MTDYSANDKVVSVCELCGLEWIARGEPSLEGTQCMVQRCYCHVDMPGAFNSLDKLIGTLEDLSKPNE